MPIWLKQTPAGIALNLYCQPGAKVSKVMGIHDGYLKIAVQAPALENKANEMLLAWLSRQLGVPQRQIRWISGQASRKKRLEVCAPITLEQVIQALSP